MDLLFRPLNAEEVEIRVDSVSARGVSLLIYKNARVDMALLDETVGAMNWQRKHSVVNNNLYCSVGIRNPETGEWVWKDDVGVEGYAAKEKSEASDSFKRSCTNWGIGRELYTAPFIFVQCATKPKEGGRGYDMVDKYQFNDAWVSHITYKGEGGYRQIDELMVMDKRRTTIYSNCGKPKDMTVLPASEEELNEEFNVDSKVKPVQLTALRERLKKLNLGDDSVLKAYKLKKIEDLTLANLSDLNTRLSVKESEAKAAKK